MAGGSQAAPLDDLRTLLEQGQDGQAYALGRAHPELLGQPFFDFFFGIAALNTGHAGEGVLALERYLLHFPENRSARFHLGRGFYLLGEDARARGEFQALVADARDDEARRIAEYLDAIRARERRYKPTASASVELGAGWDSNVNAGIAAGQVAGLPAGYVVAPGQSSEKLGSTVAVAAASAQGSYPLTPNLAVYGAAGLQGRWHRRDRSDVFDSHSLNVQAGLAYVKGRHQLRLGVDGTGLSVDSQSYLQAGAVVADWQYQADAANRFGLSAQVAHNDYRDTRTYLDLAQTTPIASGGNLRDSRLWSLSGNWTRALAHAWSPSLNLMLTVGEERNARGRPDLSRQLWGARAALSAQPAPGWTVESALSYQASRHTADFAPGIAARHDDLYQLDLGASYAIGRQWTVRGDWQRTEQRSSIGLYQYQRDALTLRLRYDTR